MPDWLRPMVDERDLLVKILGLLAGYFTLMYVAVELGP